MTAQAHGIYKYNITDLEWRLHSKYLNMSKFDSLVNKPRLIYDEYCDKIFMYFTYTDQFSDKTRYFSITRTDCDIYVNYRDRSSIFDVSDRSAVSTKETIHIIDNNKHNIYLKNNKKPPFIDRSAITSRYGRNDNYHCSIYVPSKDCILIIESDGIHKKNT